jgi:acetyl-CoA carboxylase biotin carboxyl carrier protein
MDIRELTKIVELMSKHDLTEIDIKEEDHTLTIKRGESASDAPPMVTHLQPMMQPAAPFLQAPMGPVGPPVLDPTAEPDLPKQEENGHTIVSPIVGTFYAAGSPDAPPFVNVGDEVSPDTLVCIVEAMKVMNEITADISGVVRKVLVENGHPVEYGEPLFVID